MKITFLPTTLAIAIALLAVPVARADGPTAQLRQAATQSCPKDYSKNAATGENCRPTDRIPTSSLAGTASATAPAPPPSRPAVQAGGFSWGDAGSARAPASCSRSRAPPWCSPCGVPCTPEGGHS